MCSAQTKFGSTAIYSESQDSNQVSTPHTHDIMITYQFAVETLQDSRKTPQEQ